MNKKIISNRRPLIAFFAFLLLFTIAVVKWFNDKEALRANAVLTTGKIIDYTDAAKSFGGFLNYEFKVSNKIIHSSYGTTLINQHKSYFFVGRHFPVIYHAYKPNLNKMLIHPDDFTEYNIPFPDSMRWVLEYIGSEKE